jgi:hypothetical protein
VRFARLVRGGLRVMASYRLNRRRPRRTQSVAPTKVGVLSSRRLLGSTGAENYAWEQAYETSLRKRGVPYETLQDCSGAHGMAIFWAPSSHFNTCKFLNHSRAAYCFARQLEDAGNVLFPSSREMLYWENKGYMHQQFERLGIPCPQTILAPAFDIPFTRLSYPLLFKAEHSCSSDGVYYCCDEKALRGVLGQRSFSRDETVILQRVVPATRDMRITYVGNEIMLAFWRIKQAAASQDWTSTASKYGSAIDFGDFPEQWRNFIMGQCRKFGLPRGGVDVLWENDDLSKPPLFLEVSPIFSPNPVVDLKGKPYTYSQYKKRLRPFNNFQYEQGKIIYSIADRYVGVSLLALERGEPAAIEDSCGCRSGTGAATNCGANLQNVASLR